MGTDGLGIHKMNALSAPPPEGLGEAQVERLSRASILGWRWMV